MKKSLIAALAILSMASCNKESAETPETTDPTAPVAATFSAASITRVTDNKWDTGDKIGISMTKEDSKTLADGDYENVSYTVSDAENGKFSPTAVESPAVAETIYFPVDGTTVDFYAYYPQSEINSDKDITVSVAEQDYAHIDLVAATASASKTTLTVQFTGDDNAFKHQLSKLTMNIVAGDGIDDLTGIVTTIKGQYTTAKFNIYTFTISDKSISKDTDQNDIDIETTTPTYNTTKSEAYTSAILIPTSKIAGSTIEFAVGGNTYYLDTKDFVFTQGCEHTYEITLTKTEPVVSGSTISGWGDGDEISDGKLDASDYIAPTDPD